MPGFPNALEADLLDYYIGGVALAIAQPATLHVALFSVAPADDGTGGTELSYTGYARVAVTNNQTNFPDATPGAPTSKSNGTTITFGQKTDAGSVTAVAWGLYDLGAGGNLIYAGDINGGTGTAIAQNATPRFQVGTLVLEFGDPGDTYS